MLTARCARSAKPEAASAVSPSLTPSVDAGLSAKLRKSRGKRPSASRSGEMSAPGVSAATLTTEPGKTLTRMVRRAYGASVGAPKHRDGVEKKPSARARAWKGERV
jgi:hypothetical protein